MNKLKRHLFNNIKNIIGKTLSHNIIVIETDDWGSIRMPSVGTLHKLKSAGLDMESEDSYRYNNYDTLASYK